MLLARSERARSLLSTCRFSIERYPQITQRSTAATKTDDGKLNPTPKVFANSSPGLSFWQPWDKEVPVSHQTLKGFANGANPFRVPSAITHLIPGLPKLNPGLELANTFGVKILQRRKQEVVGLLHRLHRLRRFQTGQAVLIVRMGICEIGG